MYEGQGSQSDVVKKKVLKDLEENYSKMENKAEFYEFKFHDSVKILTSICVKTCYKTSSYLINRIGLRVYTILLTVIRLRQEILVTKESLKAT